MVFGRRSQDDKRVAQAQPTAPKPGKKAVVGRDGTTHPYGGRPGSLSSGTPTAVLVAPQATFRDEQALAREKAEKIEKANALERQAAAEKAAKKAAAEKAAAEMAAAEKAATEKATAELARQEQEKQWRSELAKMSSTDAFGAQLSSKLAVDLSGLREQIEKGRNAMDATESEMIALEADRAAAKDSSDATVRALEVERSSVVAMQKLVGSFEAESAALAARSRGLIGADLIG